MASSNIVMTIAAYALPTLFAITVHEAAHAYVASKLGDKTAERQGRVTIDPRPHIDPVGTVAVPLLGLALGGILFGWAKPVPVNVGNLRYRSNSMVWVALAGPFSNMLMAVLWALVALAGNHGLGGDLMAPGMAAMGSAGVQVNMALMIVNLLPFPPLDGSRVFARFLPRKLRAKWEGLDRYAMVTFAVLMLFGGIIFPLWFAPWNRFFSWIPAIANF